MLIRKRATIQQLTAKQVTLSLENGQQLTLARDELEPTVVEGGEYMVQIMPSAEAELAQTELSHLLLNQIFASVDHASLHNQANS